MLGRINALDSLDWRLFFLSTASLPVLRTALALLSLETVEDCVAASLRFLPKSGRHADLAKLRRAVFRAGRWVPGGRHCLSRALLMQTLLRRNDIPCEIKIGVNKSEESFKAHAWVVAAGRVICGDRSDLDSFVELPDWQGAVR